MPKRLKHRISKIEQHIYFTAQEHVDLDTASLMRKRYLLTIEEETIDDEIKQLSDRLAAAKARKQKVAGSIFALSTLIERR